MSDIWEKLSRQSLGRELTADEGDFANKLEAIYASGNHDFSKVAQELGLTLSEFEAKLKAYNQSLDAAYLVGGLGA